MEHFSARRVSSQHQGNILVALGRLENTLLHELTRRAPAGPRRRARRGEQRPRIRAAAAAVVLRPHVPVRAAAARALPPIRAIRGRDDRESAAADTPAIATTAHAHSPVKRVPGHVSA